MFRPAARFNRLNNFVDSNYNHARAHHKENVMPYVNIRIAGTLSREQKALIAAEITDTLERIAHKPKSYTYIAFDELPDENWAIAGQLLDQT
jgi:4-oxalocrotonate tautomerase